jgi:hypothetical protein
MKRSVLATFLLTWPAASQGSTITGTWQGIETYQEYIQSPTGQTDSSGSGPAVFSFADVDDGGGPTLLALSLYGANGGTMSGPSTEWTLTSGSASGLLTLGSSLGPEGGSFDATIASMMPDGQIVGGSATAYFTMTYLESADVVLVRAQFVSTPEPASIVQAASALLIVAICAWLRCFHPRVVENSARRIAT